MPAASHEYKRLSELKEVLDLGWLATVLFEYEKGPTFNASDGTIANEGQQFLALVNQDLPARLAEYRSQQERVAEAIDHIIDEETGRGDVL